MLSVRRRAGGAFQREAAMKVTVQLFASLKEALGETVDVEVPEPLPVARLSERFIADHPQYSDAARNLNVAVDLTYARDNEEIAPGQEVAMFPPVSGGR